jgi:hypothetical protein
MNIKIALAELKLPNGVVGRVPFWFTGDGKIHLSLKNGTDELELDPYNLPEETIKQIVVAYKHRELSVSQQHLDILKDILRTRFVTIDEQIKLEDKKDSKKDIKAPVSLEAIEARKKKLFEKMAKDLISGLVVDVFKRIGTHVITDGIIAPGITDLNLLYRALELEERDNRRKTVVLALEKRIAALESIGIAIENSLSEATDEDYATIEIDPETNQIKTIEIHEEEEKETEVEEQKEE